MNIELFCPSRGRPAAAAKLMNSFYSMAITGQAELRFCVDDDDPTAGEYPEAHTIIGPSTGDPVGPLNRCALASKADIVGFIGDDSSFETRGWDQRVIAALQDSPGVYWGWDGHDLPWPSTYFVSREIAQALGWIALPTLKRAFFDTVWVELGRIAQVAYVDTQVMFLHDNSVHEGVAQDIVDEDQKHYNRWIREQSEKDKVRIRTVLDLRHFFPATV